MNIERARDRVALARDQLDKYRFTGHLNTSVIVPRLVEAFEALLESPAPAHPSPEFEGAIHRLFQAFDLYKIAPSPEALEDLTRCIEELREVGSLVIFGEPREDEVEP